MPKKDTAALKTNEKIREFEITKQQLEENLQELNKALISNNLLFMQLARLSDNSKPTQQPTPIISKSVDNPKAINVVKLELGETSKQLKNKSSYNNDDDEEEEEEEEEEDDEEN